MSKYNPQAFPLAGHEFGEYDHEAGMTLRDYFAAKAMQGSVERFGFHQPGEHMERHAGLCYAMADAMLAERQK